MSLAPKPGHVVIRMYNVGFGDSFLLVFPDPLFRILIDCGSHLAGPGPRPIGEVVKSVIDDVTDADGAKIDLVVCTHRHRDHIIGFADPRWKEVEVGEVWMPWTEDPRDPRAKRIRDRQSRLATALTAALADDSGNAVAAALAFNSMTNAEAMRTLHDGFAGSPPRRFFPVDEEVVGEIAAKSLKSAGIRVHVLGPSRDENVIRDMDPPAGAGYLRAAAGLGEERDGEPLFAEDWHLTSEQLALDDELKHLLLAGRERSAIQGAANGDPFGAAVALEQAINGTSLVLCLQRGDARLLFPADAQWGTWKRILASEEAVDLVEGLSLLKVGHHGSHNATPKALVELLENRPAELGEPWALVPTRRMEMWPLIPKKNLIEALEHLTPRVARSDKGGGDPAPGFASWSDHWIDVHVPLERERRPAPA
jgi:hypothetical protein